MMNKSTLFCFGHGYSCDYLGHTLKQAGNWKILGTTRDSDKKKRLEGEGVQTFIFDKGCPLADPDILSQATHILISIPPTDDGDLAFLTHAKDILKHSKSLKWLGYLSTTGVYGNRDGDWVDEESELRPNSKRGSRRQRAEEQWLSLYHDHDIPVHVFRLSGIYGPGRSALDSVRAGVATRIDKPGHAFGRIQVEDIVQVLLASMDKPNPGRIYNVCDDFPAPSHEVIAYACDLLGITKPPLVPFEEADLAPITLSFYKDNKRVKNDRIKQELGVQLKYPSYKEGLQACRDAEDYALSLFKGMGKR